MDPVEGVTPDPSTDAVFEILERMRTDLLLTIAVARMAPRAGKLAAQLIKGVQIPFMGQTYRYSLTRGRAPSVFDVCDPDGLRPGWTASSTTVGADRLFNALTYGSEHHAWGGRMWLPTFFSLWEEDYRHRLAAVHKADTDYSSLKNLILMIAHHFWVRIEQINPGQADLRISTDTYTRWRESIKTREDSKPRTGQDVILIGVRSFYYDLHTWAAEEPGQWAVWVAPCPVLPAELRGLGARRRRINDRSASRTRIRQPLLPTLVRHVEDRYDRARTMLEQARTIAVGETFVHEGSTYRRIERTHHTRPDDPIRVRDEATGTVVHVQTDEEATFWDWACVETLRHSGARIEEMCELTHLSIRQYQRPNGEVIALLVIAPSMTDRERVIPMSAELFHVIAAIVRRHTGGGRPIATLSRFDPHDKVWSEPMSFLFQRRSGAKRSVIAGTTVLNQLKRLCNELAEHHPAFRTV
ncbi:hypothetical protein AB0M45_27615 [Nocardia sp. NPDC051787]|uniref:hypothetical protein n=1 Tax=Nocardia sp. NPDC051787 TaxID=3155415 RepID=UPI00343DB3F1